MSADECSFLVFSNNKSAINLFRCASAPLRDVISFLGRDPSEPFRIAHADSESRPTATRSLAHFLCDISGSINFVCPRDVLFVDVFILPE
jgi:hypothetical protein